MKDLTKKLLWVQLVQELMFIFQYVLMGIALAGLMSGPLYWGGLFGFIAGSLRKDFGAKR
jgi:hypothetical protein